MPKISLLVLLLLSGCAPQGLVEYNNAKECARQQDIYASVEFCANMAEGICTLTPEDLRQAKAAREASKRLNC
jgi:uncharacterized protein YceK